MSADDDDEKKDAAKTTSDPIPARLGPDPVLISRSQVEALYVILQQVATALDTLSVEWILTGGSLLGAVRQHSILFTDDDVDVAVIVGGGNGDNDDNNTVTTETATAVYEHVAAHLPRLLGPDFVYTAHAWEGGDRVRWKKASNVFLDLFWIRKYDTEADLRQSIGQKANGLAQSSHYVDGLVQAIHTAAVSQDETTPLYPCYQFVQRKSVELWPKEVYRCHELYPIQRCYKMGPVTALPGPHLPVLLLRRAFGRDCFDVYYQSQSHGSIVRRPPPPAAAALVNGDLNTSTPRPIIHRPQNNNGPNDASLPPRVQPGGLWEHSPKVPLRPEHYVPTQPLARIRRRPTPHCYETLLRYLMEQSEREKLVVQQDNSIVVVGAVMSATTTTTASTSVLAVVAPVVSPSTATTTTTAAAATTTTTTQMDPPLFCRRRGGAVQTTVYMDGVFDLFHVGHLRAIEQCAALGDVIVIGVTGDADAALYKRPPVLSQQQRVAVITALRGVHRVICPCPLIVTEGFMDEHGIDLVVHGFCDEADANRQSEFFTIPMQLGKFRRIDYYPDLSTSDIIHKIQAAGRIEDECQPEPSTSNHHQSSNNPKWFSTAIVDETNGATDLAFNERLCQRIEPFIRKAADRRDAILIASRRQRNQPSPVTGVDLPLVEDDFGYCTKTHPLREYLLNACHVSIDTDLTRLHEDRRTKDRMMRSLTSNWQQFQKLFTDFVLQVCAPRFSEASCRTLYFQSFPCLRAIQPNEFSIGPHADVAYGHHPCSINFYIPLTPIYGTASLFLESQPGVEDWHPIIANYGTVKQFNGGSCLHFTPRNTTWFTRVSLDVRLIPGDRFESMRCRGSDGEFLDSVLHDEPGYYCRCSRNEDDGVWTLDEPAGYPKPDYRMGFPWTIQNWDRYEKKQTSKHAARVESAG